MTIEDRNLKIFIIILMWLTYLLSGYFIFRKFYFSNISRNIRQICLSTINFLVGNKNQEQRALVATHRFNFNHSTMG